MIDARSWILGVEIENSKKVRNIFYSNLNTRMDQIKVAQCWTNWQLKPKISTNPVPKSPFLWLEKSQMGPSGEEKYVQIPDGGQVRSPSAFPNTPNCLILGGEEGDSVRVHEKRRKTSLWVSAVAPRRYDNVGWFKRGVAWRGVASS